MAAGILVVEAVHLNLMLSCQCCHISADPRLVYWISVPVRTPEPQSETKGLKT